MKLGIISDVHAHHTNLITALDLLAREKVDQVVCAGDLVDKGPDGDKVIETIHARGIPCVLGNHDADVPSNQLWLRENAIPDHPHLLSQPNIERLAQLPRILNTRVGPLRLALFHATPWSLVPYVTPYPQQRHHHQRMLNDTGADICIYGHTHHPALIALGDDLIVNPGAVNPLEGIATCATLTLPDRRFTVFALTTGRPTPFTELRY